MYSGHFGLVESPFTPLSNASRPFRSKELDEALAHFQFARLNRENFFLLVGEVGTGKTTAIRAIVDFLGPEVPVAILRHTTLDALELLEEVLRRFGLEGYGPGSKSQLLGRIEKFLWSAAQIPVLIVDEAHLLSNAALEELRLLSNLERGERPLLQICLVGQPELLERLRDHRLRPLRQRIAVRYVFGRLTRQETRDYIRHRLAVSGAAEPSLIFTDDAADAVHEMAEGLPREINVVASQAMLNAYVENAPAVKRLHVRTTKHDYGFEGVRVERAEIVDVAPPVEEEETEPPVAAATAESTAAPSISDELLERILEDEEAPALETEESPSGRRALVLTMAAVGAGILATLAIAFLVYSNGDAAVEMIPEPPPTSAPSPRSSNLKSPPEPAMVSEPAPPELPLTTSTSPKPEPERELETRPDDPAPFEAPPPPRVIASAEPVSPAAAAADRLERGAWLARHGSLDEAIAAFREALALKPDYVDAVYNLGVSLLEKGQVGEAVEVLHRAIALSPNDGLAQRALGIALRRSGELVGAAVSLQRAVELLPNDVFALWHLAGVLRESGDLEKAIDATRKAIALKPDDARLQQELGFSLRAAGRLPEATVALQRSIDLDSNVAIAHYTLGVTLLEMGNRDAGEREIAEARRLGYEAR
jgi:type II secretory pathway predicted ATPase ExeA/Flp pilus assembly protein TadD